MKLNTFYYEKVKKIVITDETFKKENLEDISDVFITIDLESKEITQIYDFFKYITVKAVLDNTRGISINYDEIKDQPFFSDEVFEKLINLIDNQINNVNETITHVKKDTV